MKNLDTTTGAQTGTTLYGKVAVQLTGMMVLGALGSYVGAGITSGVLLIVLAIAWLIGTFAVSALCVAAKAAVEAKSAAAAGATTAAIAATAVWTFGSGLVMGPALNMYVNALGAMTVMMAFLGTAGVMAVCGAFGMLTKRTFTSLQGYLSLALWGLIIFGLVAIFVHFSPVVNLIWGGLGMLVFAGYFIVDFQLVKEMAGDNNDWPTATLLSMTLYLNFINFLMMALKFLKAISDMTSNKD